MKHCSSLVLLGLFSPLLLLVPRAAAAAVTFTPTAAPAIQDINYSNNSATFTNVSIGTPSPDREVIIGATIGDTIHGGITSVTVNGIAASQIAHSDSSATSSSSLWDANVPTGATSTIVVNSLGATNFLGILVGALTGESSAVPVATSTHPVDATPDPQLIPTSGTVTVPTDGVAVIYGSAGSNGTTTVAWTNTTNSSGDAYVHTEANDTKSEVMAHSYAAGNESYSVSGSGNGFRYAGFAGVVATWAPGTFTPPLQVDGSADDGGTFSDADVDQVTLSTSLPNDVIVLEEFNETNGGALATVSSISDTAGLSWQLRTATSTPVMISNGVTTPADMEVWYAIASAPLSSDDITVTFNNTVDDGSVIAFGVHGANLSSPWDGNSSIPTESVWTSPSYETPSVSGVSTNASSVMLLGFEGSGGNTQPGPDITDGYSDIDYTQNNGAANYSSAEAEYQFLSSAASNATISFGSGSPEWFMIGDALQAASSETTPPGRVIRLVGGLRLLGGVRLE
jgi:hypothetical protein